MIFSWYLLYIFKFKLLGNPWALWLFWCLHCWNDVRGRQEKSLSSRWKALWRANTFHCVLALKFAFRFVDRGQIFKFGPLSSLRAAPRLWTLANSLTKHCSSRVFFLGCAFLLGQNGHKKNVWIVDTADIVSGWVFFSWGKVPLCYANFNFVMHFSGAILAYNDKTCWFFWSLWQRHQSVLSGASWCDFFMLSQAFRFKTCQLCWQ